MKKTLALILALAMSLALLTACGSQEETPAEETPAEEGGETAGLPGEGMKIALVCDKIGTNMFLVQMSNALNEAAEEYGFEPTVVECADTAAFEDNIRALAAEEYDLIIGGGWAAGDPSGEGLRRVPRWPLCPDRLRGRQRQRQVHRLP